MPRHFWSISLAGLMGILVPSGGSSQASADSECRAAIFLHGLAGRGEILCDPNWLDRKGAYAIVGEARSCNTTPDAHAIVEQGIRRFDSDMKRLGKKAACAKIDRLIHFEENERGL